MNLGDVQAVIDSAKARDRGKLQAFIRETAPNATDQEVREAGDVATEVIETVPVLLARAEQAAQERRLTVVVMPLLESTAKYFVDPIDLIPEMTQGLAGLLDDTYLVLRILDNLNHGTEPLFVADFREPLRFLRRLVGRDISRKLDTICIIALRDVSHQIGQVWSEMGSRA